MDKRFEKILILLMMLASLFLFLGSAEGKVSTSNNSKDGLKNQYPGILRFHVIANSDSDEDQNLKLKVRDYVLGRIQLNLAQEMENAQNELGDNFSESAVMKEYISEHLHKIEEWGYEALKLYGYNYACTASLGIRHIPAKYYDDIFFPEGNYEALTVTIGKGEGQNWWCVVFPPLCLVDSNDSSYSDKLNMSEDDKIHLKSKILELLKEASLNNQNSSASFNSILSGIQLSNGLDTVFIY